jgi:hypothetical protein
MIDTGGKRYLTRRSELWSADTTSATMKMDVSTDGKAWVPLREQKMTKGASGAKK